MIADVRLGLRLAAGGGGARERSRAGAVVLADGVGAAVLLTTLAIAHSETQLGPTLYSAAETQRLVAAVVATVCLPVVVLVATAARLSASLRDRRLAGLRLLGLSPLRTRLVAAVESGAGALVGCLLGVVLFWLARPFVSGVQVAGRDWSDTTFTPSTLPAVLVVMGLPLLAVGVGVLPTRGLGGGLLRASRRDGVRRPSLWRLLPLVAGLALTAVTIGGADGDSISDARAYTFFAAVGLCGIGVVAVVPAFTRLLADLLVRVPGSPTLRIAGRRLQAQPAGVSRIVSGLLIGLFLVTGGRMVVGAFEDTPQYRDAARAVEGGRAEYALFSPGVAPRTALSAVRPVAGVQGTYVEQLLQTPCRGAGDCLTAFVGSCADLGVAVPGIAGCDDGAVSWLGRRPDGVGAWSSPLAWHVASGPGQRGRLLLPVPEARIELPGDDAADLVADRGVQVFVPVSTPGVRDLAGPGWGVPVVVADPSQATQDGLQAAVASVSPGGEAYPRFGRDEYDFVAGLRAIVWAVATVVLTIGLLGFAISTIDRTVGRRAEMVSLQLLGTSRRVIRAAQWWEAALPLALGLPLAVALGWSVGSGYLALGGALDARPWQSVLALGVTSALAGALIAGLTVLACAPPVRADLIRRE